MPTNQMVGTVVQVELVARVAVMVGRKVLLANKAASSSSKQDSARANQLGWLSAGIPRTVRGQAKEPNSGPAPQLARACAAREWAACATLAGTTLTGQSRFPRSASELLREWIGFQIGFKWELISIQVH